MAIELTAAYVPLIPSMKGFQNSVAKELNGAKFTGAADTAGKSIGSRIASGVTGAVKTGAKVAGAGMAAVLGTAVVKGFGRLSAIENAEAKLTGLGNSGKATAAIMENALASVKGTAFGMDEAATTAASAVAAGVQPGKELTKYLSLVGDAATIAGTDMSSMGSIFNKVMTSGKIQGDVIAQLSDVGIPVVQMLGKELGVTGEEVYDMASKGKIGSEVFVAAMTSMEGAALKGGETTTGAWKNVMAALSRFGAGLLSGIYPAIGPMFNALTSGLDRAEEIVTPWAKDVSVKVGAGLQGVLDRTKLVAAEIPSIFGSTTLTPDIVKKMGFSLDSPLGQGIHELIGGLRSFRASWIAFDGDVTSTGFPGFMERAAYGIRTVVEAVKGLDYSSWGAFKASLGTGGKQVADAFGRIGDSLVTLKPALGAFMQALPQIGGSVGTLAVAGIELLADGLGFLAEHVDTIVKFMPLIVAGFVAWKVASIGLTVSSNKLAMAQTMMAPVLLANQILRWQNIRAENRQTASQLTNAGAAGTNTAATTANNAAQSTGLVTRVRSTAAMVAQKAAMLAGAAATGIATAAQWAFNVALNANPLGLIVLAVVAVVAAIAAFVVGIKWAYNNVEWFRDGVNAVWSGIKKAAEWAWTGIKDIASSVATWFTDTALPAIKVGVDKVGQGFKWLYETIVRPVFRGILAVVTMVAAILLTIFDGIWWVLKKTLGPAFTWLYDHAVKPAFTWIQDKINAVKNWFTGTAAPGVNGGIQSIGDKFKDLYNNYVRPVIDWVKDKARSFMDWYVNVFGVAVRRTIQSVGDKFKDLYNNYVRPVIDWVKDKARSFMDWYVNVFGVAVRRTLQSIGDKFRDMYYKHVKPVMDWMGDKIKSVWDAIKSKAFDPLVKFVKETIPDTFEKAVDGIGKIWDKLKKLVSDPVEFVINTVIIDGLLAHYNKLNDHWDGADIKMDRFKGFRKGGYTGDGPVDQVAGVVHGREQVIPAEQTAELNRKRPGFLDRLTKRGAAALPAEQPQAAPGSLTYGRPSFYGPQFQRQYEARTIGFGGDAAARTAWFLPQAINAWNGLAGVKLNMGFDSKNPYVHARESSYIPGGAGSIMPNWAGYYSGSQIVFNPVARRMAPQGRRTVAIHEVGHALGLPHAHRGEGGNGAYSVMNYDTMYSANGPTAADAAALQALYPGKATRRAGALADLGNGDGGGNVLTSLLGTLKEKILGPFTKLVDQVKEKFKGNQWMDVPLGLAGKAKDGLIDFAYKKMKALPDFIDDVVDKVKNLFRGEAPISKGARIVPELHDNGGVLRPGVSVLENRTRKPEAVLNPEQTQTYKGALKALSAGAGAAGETHFHFHDTSGDPTVLARRAAETYAFELEKAMAR